MREPQEPVKAGIGPRVLRPMIRRSTKILFEVVLALVALAVILAGIAAWRLSQGPQQVNFLTDYLERAITPADSELVLSIDKTVLVWSAETKELDLRALGVRLRDQEGEPVALLPWVSVELSPTALLRGVVAPREIEIYGARLSLYQDPLTGGFSLTGGESGELIDLEPVPDTSDPESDLSAVLPRILQVLLAPPGPEQPLSYLEAVRIRKGRLIVVSKLADSLWRIPFQLVELRRDRMGLVGAVTLPPSRLGEWEWLSASFTYFRQSGTISFVTRLRDVNPEVITRLVPDAAFLSRLKTLMSGEVSANLQPDGRLVDMAFDLTSKSGMLALPELEPEPLQLSHLSVSGNLQFSVPMSGQLSAELSIGGEQGGGPSLSLTSSMTGDSESCQLAMRAKISELTARELPRLWPAALEPEARDWVAENITDGQIDQLDATAAFRLPGEGLEGAELVSLTGSFGYRGLAAHYYRPLPPVVGISGQARFDTSSLIFEADGGWLEDLQITGGKVEIVNLDRNDEALTIEVAGLGPIATALRVLDWEGLRLVSDLGLNPVGVAGSGSFETQFAFPLLEDLEVSQIRYAAQAELKDAAINEVVFGWDVRDGDMSLSVDPIALRIAGTAALEGLPIAFQWRERLAAAPDAKTAIEVATRSATPGDLKALGLDLEAYAKGPLAAEISVRVFDGDDGTLSAKVDLDRSALEVPELHWSKPAGGQAELRFSSAFSPRGSSTSRRSS